MLAIYKCVNRFHLLNSVNNPSAYCESLFSLSGYLVIWKAITLLHFSIRSILATFRKFRQFMLFVLFMVI